MAFNFRPQACLTNPETQKNIQKMLKDLLIAVISKSEQGGERERGGGDSSGSDQKFSLGSQTSDTKWVLFCIDHIFNLICV